MKKYTFAVLAVVLAYTSLTACSKEAGTATESVSERESDVTEDSAVLEDTIEIVFRNNLRLYLDMMKKH